MLEAEKSRITVPADSISDETCLLIDSCMVTVISHGSRGKGGLSRVPLAGDKRDMRSIPELGKSSGWRAQEPTPVFLPRKSHEQRSLVDYSSWGPKELD